MDLFADQDGPTTQVIQHSIQVSDGVSVGMPSPDTVAERGSPTMLHAVSMDADQDGPTVWVIQHSAQAGDGVAEMMLSLDERWTSTMLPAVFEDAGQEGATATGTQHSGVPEIPSPDTTDEFSAQSWDASSLNSSGLYSVS